MKNKLLRIILFRLLTSLFILFLVISFVFILIHLAPGNPANKFLSSNLSAKLYEEISTSYNLNNSLIEQYFSFVKNTLTGNLGISYNYRAPVVSIIKDYFSFTIMFGILAFGFQMVFTFLLVYVTFNKSNKFEKFLSNINLTLYSIPIFISSVFLMCFVSIQVL